jgi:acyl carrier protein
MIIERINSVFLEVFDDPSLQIGLETTASDIQDWDSIAQVKLVLAIEEVFNVQFETDDVAGFKSVGDVVAALRKRGVSDC